MSIHRKKDPRFLLECTDRRLDLREKAHIMGIVNTTPDSFYDGGTLFGTASSVDLERALDYALSMISNGASIIDIGGESSRPGADKISAREEIKRTVPLVSALRMKSDVLISIDTWKAEVAEQALKAGANIVNDISGFTFDNTLPGVCSRHKAAVILMHTPVKPEVMRWSTETTSEKEDILARITRSLAHSLALAKECMIENIIIDPGFGFGKSVRENFQLLKRLGSLECLGRPILAGVSRKSFLGHAITASGKEMAPPAKRFAATITAETIALMNGASILRVHDVAAAAESLMVVEAMNEA